MYTEVSATGWGWAIDNLEIQQRISGIEDNGTTPERFALKQNYPNPFNPTTTIRYELPNKVRATLTVVNINGQVVRMLVNEEQSAGSYSVSWNGLNERGLPAATGIYFYKLQAGAFSETRKMILMK